jgi:hypothetical protein
MDTALALVFDSNRTEKREPNGPLAEPRTQKVAAGESEKGINPQPQKRKAIEPTAAKEPKRKPFQRRFRSGDNKDKNDPNRSQAISRFKLHDITQSKWLYQPDDPDHETVYLSLKSGETDETRRSFRWM